MITNLADLKAMEVDYREMFRRGTVRECELAEVVALRKLIENVRGIGKSSEDNSNEVV